MAKYKPKQAQEVRERIKSWDDANKSNHLGYYEFMDFIFGEQWREEESQVFISYKKTPLTANKLAPFTNHLLGEQRKNTPQLQIEPDDGVDEETAEVREALVKKISLDGHAKMVYQNAYQCAVVGGAGAYYWDTEYDGDDTFDQNIKPFAILDTCKAYWDNADKSICKTLGMFCGFRTRMSREMFGSIYGKKLEEKIGYTALDLEDDSNTLNMSFGSQKTIIIIDDWKRTTKLVKLVQLSNGEILQGDALTNLERHNNEDGTDSDVLFYKGEAVRIEGTRMSPVHTITHTQWAGDYELDSTEFPTKKHLPVVFVDQNSYYDKHGKMIWRPFFKDARDTQKYINYLRTQMAYLVKISRADQFMASKKNVANPDTQKIWRDPSVVQGALIYDDAGPDGPTPQQLRPFEISQSLMMQYADANNDLMSTTGIYDVQMGNQGDVVSGVASDAQVKRAGVNTYVTRDALDRSIWVSGEIVNEMIPKVYDTHRILNLSIKDKGDTKIAINEPQDEYGNKIKNDMTKGNYKIRLVPGQSYEGQKSEDLQFMEMLIQAQPEVFNNIADLVVESSPMSNPQQLKNRLRAMINPKILEAGKTGNPIPPSPQQPDPMVMIKIQELQQKEEHAKINFQLTMRKLDQEQQKLLVSAHQSGIDMTVELQKIAMQKDEAEAQMADNERKFNAEIARIKLGAETHHANNVLKILTHEPKGTVFDGSGKRINRDKQQNDNSVIAES